jgi:hypothetical protein
VVRDRREMPANFCLIENHDAVATCMAEIRHTLFITAQRLQRRKLYGKSGGMRKPGCEGYFDFTTMERIAPASALVLASEFDRISTFSGAYRSSLHAIDIDKWKPAVFSALNDVGFLSMLNVEQQRTEITARNGVFILPFFSGNKVLGAQIDELIRDLAEFAQGGGIEDSETLLSRTRVYDGLGEAVQNVEDHAYPPDARFLYPAVRKWWMTGTVEPGKKRFGLIIYDQGISIPVSLPRWHLFSEFRGAFLNAFGTEFDPENWDRDGEAIAQAVLLGKSSTGKPWHGKGLPVMREIIEHSASGTLRILSRCGGYKYRSDGSSSHQTYEVPLSGTRSPEL